MDYLETKSPYGKQHGRSLGAPNSLSLKYTHSLLRTHGESLNDESLRILLVEVEGILNSRPIACESIGDVNSYLPLSLMQLLIMKTKMVMPPPGIFQKENLYCRK